MAERPPVTDWATDFDHFDAAWAEDPFPIWDELRQRCPVAHTGRYRGVYLPTRYDDIRAIAYDPEAFSSRRVIVLDQSPPVSDPAPPINSDPPTHRPARMILLPAFTPEATARLEAPARAFCRELIEGFAARGGCDGAVDYAQHIPVRVIALMLGLPAADGERFRGWVNDLLDFGIRDGAVFVRALGEIREYFQGAIAHRRGEPGDDLISFLMQQRINGEALTEDHLIGTLRLLLIAGVDTTWSAIGASLWHLAGHPEDRRRLASEPGLIPSAIEEFLRAYAPVTMARKIVKERTVDGTTMEAGAMTLLCFLAANRDPAMFADADTVIIDRKENRHAAFGLGIHRCIGSNLARMEMRVALEEWLACIPDFRLADGKVEWSGGAVRGPRRLPLTFA